MSLILPKQKLIFLHIPKCAGQSVESAFGFRHDHSHHKRNDLPEDWRNYLRFTFVRHPISRFLSACNYNLRVALRTEKQLRRTSDANLSRTKRYRLHLLDARPSISDMVNDLHQGRLRRLTTFQPQALWLRAGQPQFIGRVERFEQDLRHLFQLIDPQTQGRTAAPMPHTNQSPSRLSASELSKRELRRIRSYYRHDFRMTGYGKKPPQG